MKSWTCTSSPKVQLYTELYQEKLGQQGEGGDFLHHFYEVLSRVLYPSQEPPAQESQRAFGEDPKEGHEDG